MHILNGLSLLCSNISILKFLPNNDKKPHVFFFTSFQFPGFTHLVYFTFILECPFRSETPRSRCNYIMILLLVIDYHSDISTPTYRHCPRSRDNTVGISTGLGVGLPRSRSSNHRRVKTVCSLLHVVQIGSYPMGTRGYFASGKAAEA
jgi:hypothetical protein